MIWHLDGRRATCSLRPARSKAAHKLGTTVKGVVNACSNWKFLAVLEASEEYKSHIHNLICDNCHSHTALALNRMRYNGKDNWNMVNLCALVFFKGRRIG